jgi:hypothetical protein
VKILHSLPKPLWKFVGGLIVIVALVIIGLQFTNRQGETTKEEVIAKYIIAIQQENSEQITRLLPNSHTINQSELNTLIRSSGGKTLEITQISDIPSESPQFEVVKLTGTYKRNTESVEFTNILYLQKTSNRWYLILGRDKNGLATDVPSSKID